MIEKKFVTSSGTIVYRMSEDIRPDRTWLIFLPGLSADHRLFEKQIEYFDGKANMLVWDAPSHGDSRPFDLDWTLDDLARWLKEILDSEDISDPILIGQSLGGYITQVYIDLFPSSIRGFVSIDSCPLKREYYTNWELAALKHTKLLYLSIPWGTLVNIGSTGVAKTPYGQHIMHAMMLSYDKREYCELATHGYKALAQAIQTGRSYEIDCPILLICGSKDGAGSAKRYNREWEKRTGYPIHWIEGAGHNANCDAPDIVNPLIEQFIESVSSSKAGM